jgi:hypothetical protein
LLIEEAIDRVQLFTLRLVVFALQHLTPGLDPPSGQAKGAVAFFGRLQNLREVPVGPYAAQPCQQKTREQQPSAEPKSER